MMPLTWRIKGRQRHELVKKNIWPGAFLPVQFPDRTLLSGLRRDPGRPVIVAGGPADEFSVSSAGPLCMFRVFYGVDLKDCLSREIDFRRS